MRETTTTERVSDVRITPDNLTVLKELGLLQDLAGTWKGSGFNLIARPDFHDKTDLYLQLNRTRETLKFDPIGSTIPNRGFGMDDIKLFGLTYLQQITDAALDGALHIEPGIWVTQPATSFPEESAPPPGQLVSRMASIPHGNALLAQGFAEPFSGPPVLKTPGSEYAFSRFPSFNSTPTAVPPTAPNPPGIIFNAAGSSERATAQKIGVPPFPEYDISIPDGPIALGPLNPPFTLNTRTPYGTTPPEPPLPPSIDGVPLQDVVNDPILLLRRKIEHLADQGYEFEGTVLNIATRTPLRFFATRDSSPTDPHVTITVPQFGGGVENISFLNGQGVVVNGKGEPEENAETAVTYATFWIEKVTHKHHGHTFMQLQYAQMVLLNFPIFHLLHQPNPAYVNVGWPHISVATLRKSFN